MALVTNRQLDVARVIASNPEMTNQQIADKLGLSKAVAEFHIHEFRSRLGLTARAEIPLAYENYLRQHPKLAKPMVNEILAMNNEPMPAPAQSCEPPILFESGIYGEASDEPEALAAGPNWINPDE